MKFMAIILCLGMAAASPQGLGGINISGQRGVGGQRGLGGQHRFGPNIITNTRQATCGRFSQTCYGQGLETAGAFPVNPFIAQCQAQVAQKYGYLLRVDFDGTTLVTNSFGQPAEDIEPTPFADPRTAFNQQFNIERLSAEIEFCGGGR